MFSLKTFAFPHKPSPEACFLGLVLSALHEKDRVPEETPDLGLGDYYVRENLDHLTLEKVPGGWVFNLSFKLIVGNEIDCMTSCFTEPFPNAVDAFHSGASLVCEIVTGCPDLPFEIVGNKLMMAGYGTTAKCDT